LQRGQVLMEVTKQKQYSPLSVAEMALSLFAANEGYFDDVDLAKVTEFETALHEYARANYAELLTTVNTECDYNDDVKTQFEQVLTTFKSSTNW